MVSSFVKQIWQHFLINKEKKRMAFLATWLINIQYWDLCMLGTGTKVCSLLVQKFSYCASLSHLPSLRYLLSFQSLPLCKVKLHRVGESLKCLISKHLMSKWTFSTFCANQIHPQWFLYSESHDCPVWAGLTESYI